MTQSKTVNVSAILLITADPILAREIKQKQKMVMWVKSLPEAIAYLAKYHDADTIFFDVGTLKQPFTSQTVEVTLLPYVPSAKIVYFCRSLTELSALELKREALFKLIEAKT